ncbi:hypothetical protein DFH09DRAFT_1440916 [Mycena vulgaris]|nr:hypothetical protein DFH09DRAFT_1440916 [Mycena vulgaris]
MSRSCGPVRPRAPFNSLCPLPVDKRIVGHWNTRARDHLTENTIDRRKAQHSAQGLEPESNEGVRRLRSGVLSGEDADYSALKCSSCHDKARVCGREGGRKRNDSDHFGAKYQTRPHSSLRALDPQTTKLVAMSSSTTPHPLLLTYFTTVHLRSSSSSRLCLCLFLGLRLVSPLPPPQSSPSLLILPPLPPNSYRRGSPPHDTHWDHSLSPGYAPFSAQADDPRRRRGVLRTEGGAAQCVGPEIGARCVVEKPTGASRDVGEHAVCFDSAS